MSRNRYERGDSGERRTRRRERGVEAGPERTGQGRDGYGDAGQGRTDYGDASQRRTDYGDASQGRTDYGDTGRRRAKRDDGRPERTERGRRRKKKRGGAAATVILILLIFIVAAGIILVASDWLGFEIPFLKAGVNQTLEQAEELAASYDYDGAIATLQSNEKYSTSTQLQEAAEYESAKSAMETAIDGVIASAEELAASYDYQGGADLIKASPYYSASSVLQSLAAQYEESEKHKNDIDEGTLAEAETLAAMYDYDGAIELLKGMNAYQTNQVLQEKVQEYETAKAACVAINPEEVTHIFYHSLIVDPSKAFVEGDPAYAGMMQWMTTISEFDKITQSMYDRGYVLVSIYDLFTKTTAEDGTVTISPNQIYLPEGKKAYVLSLDDLSYYHTYDNHGIASKVVLDEEGKPTCEYIQDDGTVVYGDYDAVPRLDAFIEEHPDACYRGARGIIALTGYNGILGYRTDGVYSAEHNTNSDIYYADELQLKWLEEHPDFDWEQECEEAKKVAEAMKADGWTFASHTWGHKKVGEVEYDRLVLDTERWMQYVSPLIGGTDAIIFAHGEDLSPTGTYDSSNAKYVYLKSQGFDVYCNVDSSQYTTAVTSEYFHQGRRNLDGYRIYQDTISDNPMTADLFDASEVLDPERPGPVPDL